MAAKKTGKSMSAKEHKIYEIEIFLAETDVWRRFEIRDDTTLAELHNVIQIVMGWTDSHLHQFIDGKDNRYVPTEYDVDWDPGDISESKVSIRDVMIRKGSKLIYEYDFGDGWVHVLKVISTGPPQAGVRYPRCVAGEWACPLEDCGGPYNYYDMVDALADPKHERHEEFMDWTGGEFDAKAFSVDEVNKLLAASTRRHKGRGGSEGRGNRQ